MEPKIEPWIEAAQKISALYEQRRSHAAAWHTRMVKLTDHEIAEIIAQHAPSSPAAPTPQKDDHPQVWFEKGRQHGLKLAAEYVSQHDNLGDIAKQEILDIGKVFGPFATGEEMNCPAAPTPPTNAAEFRKTYMGAPLVIGNAMDQDAVYRFAEAYAASETARADRAERKAEEQAQRWDEYVTPLEERLDKAEADLQRKDAAMREMLDVKFPAICTHGGEPWYCDSCKYGWEKAIAAAMEKIAASL